MNYLDKESLVILHDFILSEFWGLSWIKNEWQLESLLFHIQNNKYYPSFVDKISHLFFWLIQFHCFNDWNKRSAIIWIERFLFINWYYIEDVIIKLEDIAIWVAKNEISKDNLKQIFKSMFLSFWYEELC